MNPLQYITRAILINEFTAGQQSKADHLMLYHAYLYYVCCLCHQFVQHSRIHALYGRPWFMLTYIPSVTTQQPQKSALKLNEVMPYLQVTGKTSCTHLEGQDRLWVMASCAPLTCLLTTGGAGWPLGSPLPTSSSSMASLSSFSLSCQVWTPFHCTTCCSCALRAAAQLQGVLQRAHLALSCKLGCPARIGRCVYIPDCSRKHLDSQ